jgi:hypothetical protein
MNTWSVKGLCESCGFAYQGIIDSENGSFPKVKCPACHKETSNFDESSVVDKRNSEESSTPNYQESTLEVIK